MKKKNKDNENFPADKNNDNNSDNKSLNRNIDENITKIKNELHNSSDLTINLSSFNSNDCLKYTIIYFSSLVDKKIINNITIEVYRLMDRKQSSIEGNYNTFVNFISGFQNSEQSEDLNTLCDGLLSGKTVFIVDGYNKFFSVDTFSVEGRAVEEATTQSVIRGPKEAFTEDISLNVALIRKRIRNKALRVEDMVLGSMTKTKIKLMYLDKLAKQEVINELKRRLNKIEIDGILDSGNIEELIKDDRYSVFPTFLNSEKPDSVTAELLEGKVAILVDGTAYVLTAPAVFFEFLQSSEDYYHHFIISSTIRIVRYIAFAFTLIVPAGYVALLRFHQEMIPTPLLISLAAQREGVPFPVLVEALLMESVFEILREAGIRMPRVIGPAISIVGALVLGQAAVEAGIISAVMVIIVSITAISSFAIPNYSMANAVRSIRFILMILAGSFGLYGVFMGLIVLALHLCKLKSVGVPYMAPHGPKTKNQMKDTIFRYPLWRNKLRPEGISRIFPPRVDMDDPITTKQKEKQEFR